MTERDTRFVNEMLSIHQFDPSKIEDRIDLQDLLKALGTQLSTELLQQVYAEWLIAEPGEKK